MNLSSSHLADAVEAFSALPSIGKKSALRLALHLLQQDQDQRKLLATAIEGLQQVCSCERCHNLSDEPICSICKDPRRDERLLCVVEGVRDVMAIEETGHFRGRYHVLGGVIAPIDGVGPEDLNIDSLMERVKATPPEEIIMAISPTIEGDTTIFYLSKQLSPLGIKVSTIARGVSFGGALEYADELTLGRSIVSRVPYRV